MNVKLLAEHHLEFYKLRRRLQRLVRVYTCQTLISAPLSHAAAHINFFTVY